jgi:hypothetical protein
MRKEEVEKLTEIIKKKKLKQMAEDYLEKAQENLEDEDAIASGWLLASGYVEEHDNGFYVGFDAPYASIIEYGIETIEADLFELYEWAYQKFVIRKGMEFTHEELMEMCRNVQDKLITRGIEPRYYMRQARRDVIEENR